MRIARIESAAPAANDSPKFRLPVSISPIYVNRNHVHPMIFLVSHRRGVVSQQTERRLPFVIHVRRLREVR